LLVRGGFFVLTRALNFSNQLRMRVQLNANTTAAWRILPSLA
jgi:hypothetical protein